MRVYNVSTVSGCMSRKFMREYLDLRIIIRKTKDTRRNLRKRELHDLQSSPFITPVFVHPVFVFPPRRRVGPALPNHAWYDARG
jgi:hypothetical protein